ncbi:MAG: hypothetical protein ACK42D_03785 [Candidatus Paceibacteria bacterium]
MLFSNKKDTTEYGVLFEVGSGSIAAAIVSSNQASENPVILYATREFLSLKQTTHNEDISKRLLSMFLSIALDVESKISQHTPTKTKLSTICVNFTAPWSFARGNTHTYESEEPVLITDKLLSQIKEKTTEKIVEEASGLDTLKDRDFTIINRTILGHTANHYPTTNPIGQTARTLSTTETISAVTNTILIPVKEIVQKLFISTPIEFSTSTLVQQQLIKSQIDTPSTFGTIHVTHEALELTLYRENEIVGAFTTPIGMNTIARNIAKSSKLPHEQVFSFLTAENTTNYQEGALQKIQKGFESSVLTALSDFFFNTQSSELLPRDFYLITTMMPSPAIINIITEALKKSSNNRFVLHNLNTPSVHITTDANLGSNDLGVCILAYFFHNNLINN